MDCKEVLARHSEYVDGVLPGTEADAVRMHLADCESCARYDRVLSEGVRVFSSQPIVRPDAEFLSGLHSRIAMEEEMAMRPVSASAAAYVSIAAVIALAAWVPGLLVSAQDEDRAISALSAAAASDITATEIAWHGGDAVDDAGGHTHWVKPNVSLVSSNAAVSLIDTRYSPLILDAPTAPPSYSRSSYSQVSLTAYQAR